MTFNDTSAISSDIREPDILMVEIIRPELIVDAETYRFIEQDLYELTLGPQ